MQPMYPWAAPHPRQASITPKAMKQTMAITAQTRLVVCSTSNSVIGLLLVEHPTLVFEVGQLLSCLLWGDVSAKAFEVRDTLFVCAFAAGAV